jgi:hypothetical protein
VVLKALNIGEYVRVSDDLKENEWYHTKTMKVIAIVDEINVFVNYNFKKHQYISDEKAIETSKKIELPVDILQYNEIDNLIHLSNVVSDKVINRKNKISRVLKTKI